MLMEIGFGYVSAMAMFALCVALRVKRRIVQGEKFALHREGFRCVRTMNVFALCPALTSS